jgi:L-malate glycosyltransferase
MTRVLLVLRDFYCSSMPIGGAERQALRLSRKLQEKGASVTVVTGLWDWGQPGRQMLQGVPVHRLFTAWGMFDIRGLRKFGQYLYLLSLFGYLVRNHASYDVIHCHSAMFEAAIVIATARLLRKPALIRSMASGGWGDLAMVRQDRSIKGTGWMLRQFCRADAVVALNNQVSEEMQRIGVAEESIVCIPNGIEPEPDRRKSDYSIGDSVKVVFVGRLHPQKGVDTLLKALKLAAQTDPHDGWRLVLAGTGPLEQALRSLAAELGISEWVEFLGQVEDVDGLLNQSDLFALPSFSEGMSNALLEAMAHGLPCIVTDIPGNHDLIRDKENGLLVPVDDPVVLAQVLVETARDEPTRRRLGQGAYQTVQTHYSLSQVADRYIQLYERLTG